MKYLLLGFLIGCPLGFVLIRLAVFIFHEFAEDVFYWFSETSVGKKILSFLGW